MRPSAPVDLNLHGLGGIVVNNGAVHGGEGGRGRHVRAAAPRKPWKPRGDAGDPMLGKLADEKEERFPLKLESDGYHYDGPSFSAKIAMDGTVTFDDHSIRDFKGLSGGFDLTDLAMKANKQDPYRYEKERFMDNDVEAARRADERRRARRSARVVAGGAALAPRATSGAISTTRRASGAACSTRCGARPPAATTKWARPGSKARATIEAFIRERLPEGSDGRLHRRRAASASTRARARVKFEPYAQQLSAALRGARADSRRACRARARSAPRGTSRVAERSRAVRAPRRRRTRVVSSTCDRP